MRDAEAVIHRRRVQEEDVGGEERLFPNGYVGFCMVFAKVVVAWARCQYQLLLDTEVGSGARSHGGVPVSIPGKLSGAVLGKSI